MAKVTSLLGLRIRARLKETHQTQTWLAEKLGLSGEAVSRWIKGESDPQFSNLKNMSVLLKCSIGYLAGDHQDEYIAEVVRRMEAIAPEMRKGVLDGVIAVIAATPKTSDGAQMKTAT